MMTKSGLTVEQVIEGFGATVAGIAMMEQIAEDLEYSQEVIIKGPAREATLAWLRAWRAQGMETNEGVCSDG